MSRSPLSRTGLIRLIAGLPVPVIAFLAFLRTLGNATEALAITEAIPVLWVVAYAVWRRRIEPLGATAIAGFGIALLLTIALGGSSLPLELHRALFPGAVGLACLISLAARRPLLEIAKSKLAKERPEATVEDRSHLDASDAHHGLAVLTAVIGVTMSADAAAQITLALAVSPATFGVAAHIAAWVIIGVGVAVCVLYLRWTPRRHRDRMRPPGPESTPGPHSPPTELREMPTSNRSATSSRW
jgi:hypothetical protein